MLFITTCCAEQNIYHDHLASIIEFRSNRMMQYEKISADDDFFKIEAKEFFRAHDQYILKPDGGRRKDLCLKAKSLLQSSDPMLKIELAHVLRTLGTNFDSEQVRALEQVRQSKKQLLTSDYSIKNKVRSYRMVLQLVSEFHENYQNDHERVQVYSDLMIQWLNKVAFRKDELRAAYDEISYFFDHRLVAPKIMRAVIEKVEKQPVVHPWLKNMIKGKAHLMTALNVSKNKNIHLKKTAGYFKDAHQLIPEYPEASTAMITISRFLDDTKTGMWEWFDNAIAVEIDHEPAYNNILDAIELDESSDKKKLVWLGIQCMESDRYDSLTPFYFFKALARLFQSQKNKNLDWLKEYHVFDMAERIVNQYLDLERMPAGLTKHYLNSLLLALALKLDRSEEITKYHGELRWDVDKRAIDLFSVGFDLKNNILYAHALKSKESELAKKLFKALNSNDFSDQKVRKELLAKSEKAMYAIKNPFARYYFSNCVKSLYQEIRFEKGENLNLTFDEDLIGWQPAGGEFKVDRHGALRCGVKKGEHLYFYHRSRFTPPYELQMTVDFVSSPLYNNHMEVGVGFGDVTHEKGHLLWMDGWSGRVGVNEVDDLKISKIIPKKRRKIMKIRVWNDYVEIADPHHVYVYNHLENLNTSKLGVGLHPFGKNRAGRISLSNLKIVKLKESRPDKNLNTAKLAEFYHKRSNKVKSNENLFLAALKLYEAKRFDESLSLAYELKNRNKNSIMASALIGWNLMWLGDFENAIIEMEKVVKNKTFEYQSRTLSLLSYLLSTCYDGKYRNSKRSLELAKELIDRPGELTPSFLEVLAHAYAASGDFKIALEVIEKTLEMTKTESDINRRKEIVELFKKKRTFVLNIEGNG